MKPMATDNERLYQRAISKLREAELEERTSVEKPLPLDTVKKHIAAVIAEVSE